MPDFLKKLQKFLIYLLDITLFRWIWDKKITKDSDKANGLFLMFSSIAFYSVLILFYPIKLVFSGEWELNQKINLGEIQGYGSIDLRFYAIFMLAGLISGYLLSLRLAKIKGLADTVIDRLFVGLVVFGLIGARTFYIIFNFEDFSDSWLSLFEIYKGGLAIFGAILASGGYLIWYCRRYKFNFWFFADFVAPSLLLGQIIGRFGNFFNYESYGLPTKVWWGMHVPDSANLEYLTSRYFHPTFLYEILGNSILFLFILKYYTRLTQKHAGLIFSIYCIGYGLIRMLIEPIRIDPLVITLPNPIILHLNFLFQTDTIDINIIDLRVSSFMAFFLLLLGVYTYLRRSKIYVKYQTATEIKYK